MWPSLPPLTVTHPQLYGLVGGKEKPAGLCNMSRPSFIHIHIYKYFFNLIILHECKSLAHNLINRRNYKMNATWLIENYKRLEQQVIEIQRAKLQVTAQCIFTAIINGFHETQPTCLCSIIICCARSSSYQQNLCICIPMCVICTIHAYVTYVCLFEVLTQV